MDKVINFLQNYYGDVTQGNKDDLPGMAKGIQASLLHSNSGNENPCHNLCPVGPYSWCKRQKAKVKGEEYHHRKRPIPEAILHLLKPIYAQLDNRELRTRELFA